MSDQLSDPFERAAQREQRIRGHARHVGEHRERRLRVRLKWLAFLALTLPFVLFLTDWEVTTVVIVQLGLLTITAVLVAWAWIDTRSLASGDDLR